MSLIPDAHAVGPTPPGEPTAKQTGEGLPDSLRAVAYLLRPLVRFLLARGITFPTMGELLKRVYLRVAVDEIVQGGEKPTDSRISLLTGLHRKDVRRLREEPEEALQSPRMVNWGSRLVSLWLALPTFREPDGTPRPLKRLARDGGERSFESLAGQVTRDIGPKAILDELLRNHVVTVDADDQVRLAVTSFVPRHNAGQMLHFFANNLHDHLAAAAHNMVSPEAPMLERCVHYTELSRESLQSLERLAEAHATKALIAVNEAAQALKELDRTSGAVASCRMRLGVYFLRDDADAPFVTQKA